MIADKGQVGPVADYFYSLTSSDEGLWSGSWGLMRAFSTRQGNLLPLPNNPVGSTPFTATNEADFNGVCPKTAPVRALMSPPYRQKIPSPEARSPTMHGPAHSARDRSMIPMPSCMSGAKTWTSG